MSAAEQLGSVKLACQVLDIRRSTLLPLAQTVDAQRDAAPRRAAGGRVRSQPFWVRPPPHQRRAAPGEVGRHRDLRQRRLASVAQTWSQHSRSTPAIGRRLRRSRPSSTASAAAGAPSPGRQAGRPGADGLLLQTGDPHIGIDHDPEGLGQRSAHPGERCSARVAAEVGRLLLAGCFLTADAGPNALDGSSHSPVLTQCILENLVLPLSRTRCGDLRLPESGLVGVRSGLLPSHDPI